MMLSKPAFIYVSISASTDVMVYDLLSDIRKQRADNLDSMNRWIDQSPKSHMSHIAWCIIL